MNAPKKNVFLYVSFVKSVQFVCAIITTIEVFYYRMTGRGKASDNKIEWVKRGKRRKKDISKSGLLDFVYLAQGKECDAPTRIFPRIFQINKLCDTTYTRFKADVGSEYRIELEGIMKS